MNLIITFYRYLSSSERHLKNCFFFKFCIYIQYDKNQVGVGCKRMDLWLGTNHSSFGANQLNLGMNRLNLGGYEATVGTNRLDTA